MEIPARLGRQQPPNGTRYDVGHQLAKGLVSSLELNSSGIFDPASREVFGTVLGIGAAAFGRPGLAMQFAGTGYSTGKTSIGGVSLFSSSSTPFTVSVMARFSSTSATGTLLAKASATAGNRTFQMFAGAGSFTVNVRGTATDCSALVPTNDTAWHLYTYTLTPSGSGGALLFDDRGVIGVTIGSASEETSEPICIGSRTGTAGAPLSGAVQLVRIWNNTRTPTVNHMSLYRDAWSMFKRRVLVPVASLSGVPVLSAAGATSIGTTYATPRVTVTFS